MEGFGIGLLNRTWSRCKVLHVANHSGILLRCGALLSQ